jgi:hypothetical protein
MLKCEVGVDDMPLITRWIRLRLPQVHGLIREEPGERNQKFLKVLQINELSLQKFANLSLNRDMRRKIPVSVKPGDLDSN